MLVILSHDRRKIIHVNVTEHPTAEWTARQVQEAIGLNDTPQFLLRDNDAIFGSLFQQSVATLGPVEVTTARRSPWQNPYVERVIGSIRRECLDHTIIIGERHLRRVIANYVRYYNKSPTTFATTINRERIYPWKRTLLIHVLSIAFGKEK